MVPRGIGSMSSGSVEADAVRILFFVNKKPRLRHFEEVVRSLADRGHQVRLALPDTEGVLDAFADCPNVSAAACPKGRRDRWKRFVGYLRGLRDFVRYGEPRFRGATALRRRAYRRVHWAPYTWGVRLILSRWSRRPLEALLRRIEEAVPSDPMTEKFLASERPDAVLVTPLVHFTSSYQVDFIKAAHRLGIPVAFLPYSWDNLTNKGHMRILPDRVFVWNETQKAEAVELHGVPPERVSVCGGWRFDNFFDLRPRMRREEFCAAAGLRPDRPYIVYLCSSDFVAAEEIEFVQSLVRRMKSSGNPALAECGILVKPYPQEYKRWKKLKFVRKYDNVAVLRNDVFGEEEAKKNRWGAPLLYETLCHAHAVFGLNTSAMIEAAILAKPVFSLLVKQFEEGQNGTVHFHYFRTVGGGLIHLASDMGDLLSRLAECLSRPSVRDEKSLSFVRAFVRPAGLDRPAVPVVVEEIERLREIRKPRAEPSPAARKAEDRLYAALEALALPRLMASAPVRALTARVMGIGRPPATEAAAPDARVPEPANAD